MEQGVSIISQASIAWITGLIAIILLLALIGFTFQIVATKLDERKYPPPGRLVDIGGYRLHLHPSEPADSQLAPAVILDAGLGDCSLTWSLVQPEISKFAPVFSYDRAGLGWSDPAPAPRTSKQMVKELHTLLESAGINKPYVIVGHSFGGLNALLYAAQYPDEVAGIVLVDSAHEEQSFVSYPVLLQWGPLTAPLGLPRLFASIILSANPLYAKDSKYPPAYRAIVARTSYAFGFRKEYLGFEESLAEARATARPLGNIPLIVVSACQREHTEPLSKEHAESYSVWKTLQQKLAQKSTNGKQVIAEGSGHFIQYDRPDLVIAAVREVVNRVRGNHFDV